MPVTPAAAELLKALSQVLARWGPWYLFGAQAVIAYGVPRLSADVDVTLRLTPDTPDRFALEMRDDPRLAGRPRLMNRGPGHSYSQDWAGRSRKKTPRF